MQGIMLTAIVTTYNNEATIRPCLESLSFADEIVLVDSGSTDNTLAIATEYSARIVSQPWLGYGAQKNVGAAAARGTWVLFVDSDEEIPPLLGKRMKAICNGDPEKAAFNIYWLRTLNIFFHRPLRHLYGHNARLFKRGAAQWNNATVHEQVSRCINSRVIKLGDPDTGIILPPLFHHSYNTVGAYLKKMHRYTTLDAKQMAAHNRHRSGRLVRPVWHTPYRLAARQLVKMVVYRHGILDGWRGMLWCVLSSYYEFELGQKYLRNAQGEHVHNRLPK